MRLHLLGSLLAAAALCAAPAAADVQITIANGTVTISAKDATVRQILTEWARVGQTRIVNLERVSGAPLSLELTNVPEAQALDTVLRSVSGYLAAPRSVELPNASRYDRIYILPTSTGTASRPATPIAGGPAPFAPPTAVPAPDDQPDDDANRPQVPVPPQLPRPNGQRGPIFSTFPQPQGQPRQAPVPAAPTPPEPTSYPTPTVPVGVSTPGMLVPAPQQPGQAQPGQAQPGDSVPR